MLSFCCGTYVPVRCHKFGFHVEIPLKPTWIANWTCSCEEFSAFGFQFLCYYIYRRKICLTFFIKGGLSTLNHAKPRYQPMPSMRVLIAFALQVTFTLMEFYQFFIINPIQKSKSSLKNTGAYVGRFRGGWIFQCWNR